MKQFTSKLKLYFLIAITTFLVFFISPIPAVSMEGGAMEGHDMTGHHQHIMLNHALAMVLEGSNLVMLSEMNMAKDLDLISIEHGKMMMKNGKSLLTEIMTGKAMMTMHGKEKDPMKDPAMAYTHKLGEKQLIVIDMLDKMKMDTGSGMHGMIMHHQHMMLNHALKMALEGSNYMMIGQMGMAKGIDTISIRHGKMMMKNGRELFNEVMSGDTMMNMHKGGVMPENNEMMKSTHILAEAQLQVLSILEDMPAMGE